MATRRYSVDKKVERRQEGIASTRRYSGDRMAADPVNIQL